MDVFAKQAKRVLVELADPKGDGIAARDNRDNPYLNALLARERDIHARIEAPVFYFRRALGITQAAGHPANADVHNLAADGRAAAA